MKQMQLTLLPLLKALQYVTFLIGNISPTKGYRMSPRQLGFVFNVYDGQLTVFLNTIFADMYSPITVIIMNGAGDPLGQREVILLENEPCMPTPSLMTTSSSAMLCGQRFTCRKFKWPSIYNQASFTVIEMRTIDTFFGLATEHTHGDATEHTSLCHRAHSL